MWGGAFKYFQFDVKPFKTGETFVLGFRIAGQNLGESQAPMRVLAQVAGAPILGLLIDIFALVSLFACTLACITAAARVLKSTRCANTGTTMRLTSSGVT